MTHLEESKDGGPVSFGVVVTPPVTQACAVMRSTISVKVITK